MIRTLAVACVLLAAGGGVAAAQDAAKYVDAIAADSARISPSGKQVALIRRTDDVQQLLVVDLEAKQSRVIQSVKQSSKYALDWVRWKDDDRLVVGATVEHTGFEERNTVGGVRGLFEAVCDLVPGAWNATLLSARVGLRPGSPDPLPIIGWSGAVPRLMYATGHYRNGVLLAPLTAELVANAMVDGTDDPALRLTSPSRFGTL